MESTPTVLLVPTSVVPRPGAPWRAMNQCQAVPPSALTVVTVLLRAARKQRLCSVPAHSRIQLHPCAFAKSQLKNQFNWQWRVPVINMGRPGLCRRIFVVVVFQSYSLSGRILGLLPSQWETSLQSNSASHWLGANLESALVYLPYTCLHLVWCNE